MLALERDLFAANESKLHMCDDLQWIAIRDDHIGALPNLQTPHLGAEAEDLRRLQRDRPQPRLLR